MHEDKTKYLNFPIFLIEDLMIDKDRALKNILYCGIYSHSLKFDKGDDYEKFLSSAKYYNTLLGGDKRAKQKKFETGRDLYNKYISYPITGLNIEIFWDYYKNDKTEFEVICLVAYLALKSIIGRKPYCKVTNGYLWARMCGFRHSIDDVNQLLPHIKKYANEYQTVKIKKTLRDDWGMRTYSRYTRGFYISFTIELDSLVFEAEKRRKITKEKQYRELEKIAIQKAMNRLNTQTNHELNKTYNKK